MVNHTGRKLACSLPSKRDGKKEQMLSEDAQPVMIRPGFIDFQVGSK